MTPLIPIVIAAGALIGWLFWDGKKKPDESEENDDSINPEKSIDAIEKPTTVLPTIERIDETNEPVVPDEKARPEQTDETIADDPADPDTETETDKESQ